MAHCFPNAPPAETARWKRCVPRRAQNYEAPPVVEGGPDRYTTPGNSGSPKGLVDVVKGFDSAPAPCKKFPLPCSSSGASLHTAGDECRCASFIAVVHVIRRQGPFPSND